MCGSCAAGWGAVNKMKHKVIIGVFLLIFSALPLLLLLLQSIAPGWGWGELFPSVVSVQAWQTALGDPALREAVIVTIMVILFVAAGNVIFGVPAAKMLAYKHFRGKLWLDNLLFLPILIPMTAVAMGIHFTFIRAGLADTWFGTALVLFIPTLPYTIRVLRAGFERFGPESEEQAKSLGSTTLQALMFVQLPQIMPSLRSAVFLTVVITAGQYILPVIIGGGTVPMLSLLYFPYSNSANEAVVSALSLLFALLPLVVILLAEMVMRLVFAAAHRR